MSWMDNIQENIKSRLIEMLILSLLSTGDMYGYQIKIELANRTDQAFLVKEGSLYGPLYRMEERKLISSRKELVGQRRIRNYYHLEDSGNEYLRCSIIEFQKVFNGSYRLLKGCGLLEEPSQDI